MPSLNAKRKVTYTAADLRAVDGALAVVQFMNEFAGSGPDFAATLTHLKSARDYIEQQRNGTPEKKRETK